MRGANRRPPGRASAAGGRGLALLRALGWGVGGPGQVRADDVLFHRGVSGTALWVDRRRPLVVALLSAQWFLPREFYAAFSDLVFGGDL